MLMAVPMVTLHMLFIDSMDFTIGVVVVPVSLAFDRRARTEYIPKFVCQSIAAQRREPGDEW